MKTKRILLSVVLVLSMLIGMAVPVSAAGQPTLIVTCDTENINVGTGTADVVYTISLDPNGTKVAAFQFDLKAPAGMTLSENKLKPAVSNKGGDGYWVATKELKYNEEEETGIFDTIAYSTSNNRCAAFGGLGERVLKNTAVIMTIKATVAIDQVKDYTMAVEGFLCFGTGAVDLNALNPVVVPTVSVVSAATPATGISLDKTALDMYIGDTVTLTATVTPAAATDKTVTWSSSDTGVATVDNGKIKAVGKGKATITAKTVNGKTATCEVTVYGEISVPTAISGLIYNGSEQIGVAEGTGYTLSGHKATNAGSYTATASLKSGYKWADGTTTAKTVSWKIDKKTVTPTVEVTGTYKYTGKAIIPTVVVKDGTKVIPATEYNVKATDNTNAGTAKVTVTNKDGGNYVIETKEASFTIGKGTQNAPSGLNGVAPSINTASDGKITGVTDKMEYRKAGETTWRNCTGTEITGLAAGTYEVRFKENVNQTASAATQVVISTGATSVSVPTAISGLIYNGSEQIGVAEGTGYTLSGHKATNAGSYTATASLKSGYKWADGTTTAKTVSWKIDKKTVTPTVEVTGTYKYTGKAIIPTVVVKDGTKVIPATEYNVKATDNTNAGTAKVTVTNKDGGNYMIETKEASFTIGKGTQNKPSGLNGVAPAVVGESTGKITGVSDKMEYRKAGETTWRNCTGTEITGLAAGDYEIRMKATANEDASAITTVTVRARRNTNTDSADRAYEEAKKNEGKKNTPTGGELVIISTVAVSIILLSSLIVFLAIVVSKKKKSVR